VIDLCNSNGNGRIESYSLPARCIGSRMLKTPTRLAGILIFSAVSLLISGHAFSQSELDLLNAKPGQPLPRLPDGIIRHGNNPPISPRRPESTNIVRQEVRDQPPSARLGVTPASMGGTSQTARGALVVTVFPGSPAAISQLQRGDVILAVDDKELEVGSEPAALARTIASHVIGTTVRAENPPERTRKRSFGNARFQTSGLIR
jgi:hypothetical protein